MERVSVRDLRNHGGEVLDRVARGETVIVTRDGADVAQLSPHRRPSPPTVDLIALRRRLPTVDPARLRADIDTVLDSQL